MLKQRGPVHGDYGRQGTLCFIIKELFKSQHQSLSPIQSDSLDMIAVKISRILIGDPDYKDHWVDIAGYATLVAERLK